MATIVLSVERLTRGRLLAVQQLLSPLRERGRPVSCQFAHTAIPSCKVIAAATRRRPDPNYRNWWFPSFEKTVRCQYCELWQPLDGEDEWVLNKAYLHLARADQARGGWVPILCVHSDPGADEAEPLRRFKQGPHLHVVEARDPLPRCHFPLNLGHLDQVLSSAESITRAMRSAIDVLRDDVIPKYAS